jgi:hypothetical protein
MVTTSDCAIGHSGICRIRGKRGGFHAEVMDEPIRWEDDYIIPLTRPSLMGRLPDDRETLVKGICRQEM